MIKNDSLNKVYFRIKKGNFKREKKEENFS